MASDTEWNVDMEVNLFHAMRGHKPAGVSKHFQMIAIHDKLSSSTKKITAADIWKHLATLYDLNALNESEIVPFPNKSGEFSLTDREISELCQKAFPRSSFINSAPTENVKSEGTSKSSSKNVKTESRTYIQTPKSENKSSESQSKSSSSSHKSDTRNTTPSSQSSSTTNTPSGRGGSDHHKATPSSTSTSKSSHSTGSSSSHQQTPNNRRQRKRTANSSSNSPATPSESHGKRRR